MKRDYFKDVFLIVLLIIVIFTITRLVPEENNKVSNYFIEQAREEVVDDVGQPIEGFEPFMFLETYPGLIEEDFNNVQAELGVYKYENGELVFVETEPQLHTAARAITDDGMRSLLNNLETRLNMDLRDEDSVDTLLGRIDQNYKIIPMENAVSLILEDEVCNGASTEQPSYNSEIEAWIFMLPETNNCLSPVCRVYDTGLVEYYKSENPCFE